MKQIIQIHLFECIQTSIPVHTFESLLIFSVNTGSTNLRLRLQVFPLIDESLHFGHVIDRAEHGREYEEEETGEQLGAPQRRVDRLPEGEQKLRERNGREKLKTRIKR